MYVILFLIFVFVVCSNICNFNLLMVSVLNVDVLKKYLEDEIFLSLGEILFLMVYVNIGVSSSDNFLGILVLSLIYEVILVKISENLDLIYFFYFGF